jgi:serine/threonine protein kinase
LNLPEPIPIRVGQAFGPYRIEAVIARGGQGVVLNALHVQYGRRVALKLLLAREELPRKRFLREIQSLARLSHPNLPRALDVGEFQGVPYVAIELVEGKSLRDLVRERGVLPDEFVVETMRAVAGAIQYCHENGILHRDLKPGNVVIEAATGRPVVVDFGVVKLDPEIMGKLTPDTISRLSMTGEFVGTPAFMAPEQASSDEFGPLSDRTDVYGLGGILYFLLTGEEPYKAQEVFELILAVMESPAPDPRALNPQAPAALASVCMRSMEKRPTDRYESAAQFSEALAGRDGAGEGSTSKWALALVILGALSLLVAAALNVLLATSAPVSEPTPARGESPLPTASVTASDSARPEPASPRGSLRWKSEFKGRAGRLRRVGPHLLIRSSSHRGWIALDSKTGAVGDWDWIKSWDWAWDAKRKRILGIFGDEVFTVIEGKKVVLAQIPGPISIAASPEAVVVGTTSGKLCLFQPEERKIILRRSTNLGSRLEASALLLDLDGDSATDHFLVVQASGQASLSTLNPEEGQVHEMLPFCVRLPLVPLAREARGGVLPVLVTCSDGTLVRLRVEPGRLSVERTLKLSTVPRLGSAVAYDSKGDASAILVGAFDGVVCVAPGLERVEWNASQCGMFPEPPGTLLGLDVVDMDQDGRAEVAAAWGRRGGRPLSTEVYLYTQKGESFAPPLLLEGRSYLATAGPGQLAAAGIKSALSWGPWRAGGRAPRDKAWLQRLARAANWKGLESAARELGPPGAVWAAYARWYLGDTAPLNQFGDEHTAPMIEGTIKVGPTGRETIDLLLRAIGQSVPRSKLPTLEPASVVGPFKEGPPLSARWVKGGLETRGVTVEVAGGSPSRRNMLGEGGTVRLMFTLPLERHLELRINHACLLSNLYGYAAITLRLDKKQVGWHFELNEEARWDRFPLGLVSAGEHEIRIEVHDSSRTLYHLSQMRVEAPDAPMPKAD